MQLSKAAKVGSAQVYRAARGAVWPSDAWLARIAKVLDVSVADLLGGGLAPIPNVGTLRRAARKVAMDPNLKESTFKIRLSPHDRAQLEAVAAASSLSAAGVLRSLVAREARALGIVVETPKPTKKTKR